MSAEKLPVYRPFGGVMFYAPAGEIRAMIRAGCAQPITRRNKSRLYGARLLEGPSRPQPGTRYVHCREVAESWTDSRGVVHHRHVLEANVRGVYCFKRLSHLDRRLFFQVQTDCLK